MTNAFMTMAVSLANTINPKGLNWIGDLLLKLFSAIGTVGVAVIIFTLIVKVIVLPLDIYSRVSSKKNEFKMKRMKPQLEKLKKQYANNPQLYQQKLSALYKKEGYGMMGQCLPVIVSMIFFIVVFNAFRSVSYHEVAHNYNDVVTSFNQVIVDKYEELSLPMKEVNVENGDGTVSTTKEYNMEALNAALTEEQQKALIEKAQEAAKTTYEKVTPGFLWVKNIWVPDNAFDKSVPSHSKFKSIAQVEIDQTEYEMVTGKLVKDQVNGYFILPVLCMAFSFLSQWLMQRMQKEQQQLQTVDGQPNTMKMMSIMMPIMFGVFALSYSGAFALYMIISSLYSTISSLAINAIATKVIGKKFAQEAPVKTVVNR